MSGQSQEDEMKLFREKLLSRMISRDELESGVNGINDVSGRVFGIIAKSGAAPEFILLMRIWAELITRNMPHVVEANRGMEFGRILNFYEMADEAKRALEAYEGKASPKGADGIRGDDSGGLA